MQTSGNRRSRKTKNERELKSFFLGAIKLNICQHKRIFQNNYRQKKTKKRMALGKKAHQIKQKKITVIKCLAQNNSKDPNVTRRSLSPGIFSTIHLTHEAHQHGFNERPSIYLYQLGHGDLKILKIKGSFGPDWKKTRSSTRSLHECTIKKVLTDHTSISTGSRDIKNQLFRNMISNSIGQISPRTTTMMEPALPEQSITRTWAITRSTFQVKSFTA